MATLIWEGTADAVAQSDDVTITANDVATTYTLTVGGETVSTTGNASGANETATDLATAWNASTHPYFAAATAAATGNTVTVTVDTAGVQLVATSSATGGNGTIGNVTANVTLAGPNVWATAANWSTGNAPTSGDDVIIPAGASPIIALPSSAQTINSLTVELGADDVGRDASRFSTSADGQTFDESKRDYRTAYLKVNTATIRYGVTRGATVTWSAKRHLLEQTSTAASVLDVHTTPSSAPTADQSRGTTALRFLASDADADVYVRTSGAGGVGIGMDTPNETATVGTVEVADTTTAARVRVGRGTTVTTYRQSGGTCTVEPAALTTCECRGGSMSLDGTYTLTTLTVDGGTCADAHIASSGNSATTVNVRGGTLDLQTTRRARQYGTITHTGGTIQDDPSVTMTTFNRARATITVSS